TDNVYHIMVAIGTISQHLDATLVIDGFQFVNGNADEASSYAMNGLNVASNHGGGVYTYYSDAIISNCIFQNNNATYGGGIFAHASSASILDCRFSDNNASLNG